ncbi:ribosomal protein S18-alanine N-acetyltransferase [Clostridium fallax]|uniref:[Ribosomal protein bS18]-alanine N-acetyltransferase n=1 Tax=Clostridium fallax TaxID=1533 RepID=A0A1M4VDM3_9CLOT|nr:ribosomal protein S18-alanine N-acetyltransferase [Clostridium fallax]SHE66973.1 ribosomal-protein-alanine N-acetyltransferase [Clostridium fallax]SQB05770.1 ribosomal-protein-alanine acetyltransferase RimI [Clostridium fallax]
MDISLSFMTKEDIDGVLEISNSSFAIPWSKNSFELELENSFARYVIAKDKNKVIGFGGMWLIVDECHITNIAVHSDYRGNGVGSMILTKMISFCEENNILGLTLEVRKSNLIAKNLYKKFGFKEEGIRQKYYENNGEDAIIMWKRY